MMKTEGEATRRIQVSIGPVLFLRGLTAKERDTIEARYTYQPRLAPGAPLHAQRPPLRLVTALSTGEVCVPRDLALLPLLEAGHVVDLQRPGPLLRQDPRFHATLDPGRRQVEAVDAVMRQLTSSPYGGGALLSLPVGYGKTLCALWVASRLSERTLILVHTTMLADQWIDRIKSLVGDARPVHVTAARFEQALGTPEALTHAVILMQTLLSRATTCLSDHFDMVIVDETHHLAAPTLSQCMALAGVRYRLGLSATLVRQDGMHNVLHHLIGPVAFHTHRQTAPDIVVRAYRYMGRHDTTARYTVSQAVTHTAADVERTRMLVSVIRELHEVEERYVLVLSDRKEQLRQLASLLQKENFKVAWAIGGTKVPVVDHRPVVLATYAFASEGMDVPQLNACVLATSRCELKQSIGRILRKPDSSAVVCDVVDHWPECLRRQFYKRKRWYVAPLDEGGLAASVQEVTR